MNQEQHPVEYEGRRVVPGEIHDFQDKIHYPMVDEGAEHYTILKDGSPKKVMKAHENKHFKVNFKHQVVGDPSAAINEAHLVGAISKKQKDLVVGTDIERSVKDHVSRGVHADEGLSAPFFTENAKGKRIFIKPGDPKVDEQVLGSGRVDGFPQAKREVAFHNAMHEVFGLGEHVPATVAFTMPGHEHLWTAQEFRPGKHLPYSKARAHGSNHPLLRDLHAAGTTQKLAVADWILGNQDRHVGNYLVEENPSKIHVIDHGGTFQYHELDHLTPEYISSAHQDLPFDQSTHAWIGKLKYDKLKKTLEDVGVPEPNVRAALGRLERIQDAVHNKETLSSNWMSHPSKRPLP